MEHKIKTLAEAITNTHTKHLVQDHINKLHFADNHLIIFVDNAGPLHEFEEKETDHHLKAALEKIYGEDITYEFKIEKHGSKRDLGEQRFI